MTNNQMRINQRTNVRDRLKRSNMKNVLFTIGILLYTLIGIEIIYYLINLPMTLMNIAGVIVFGLFICGFLYINKKFLK